MPNPPDSAPQTLFISEIEIIPVRPKSGLVAFSSCVINGQIYLGNIGIHTRLDGSGFRLVFPVKVLPNGKEINCFYPITRKAADQISQAIVNKFEALIESSKIEEKVATNLRKGGGSKHEHRRIFQNPIP